MMCVKNCLTSGNLANNEHGNYLENVATATPNVGKSEEAVDEHPSSSVRHLTQHQRIGYGSAHKSSKIKYLVYS